MELVQSQEEAEWTPRRELCLPNELIHKIILQVLRDGVHTICVSSEDTTWEKGMMDTLHGVSVGFKAISTEIALKAFDIPKYDRTDDGSIRQVMRKIFIYLGHLGTRLRHPSHWGSVSFQTIDCTASSIVFGYALYLSCLSLRRNASRSPREVFDSTHKVILSALVQSQALCERVYPVEMTYRLRESIDEEFALARYGLTIVHSFSELQQHAHSLEVLRPTREQDGSGPISAVHSLIHTSLSKIEEVHEEYAAILADRALQTEPKIYDLPGVHTGLRTLSMLQFDEDEFNLGERIHRLVGLWSVGCPFLNKDAKLWISTG
ncbi:hypothetical protein CPC08DRAFT_823883 [Agrocybe pediades]|nr:hypothetical protein CPC08DRAFT_823883 [Agrocybe pediades]